MAYKYNYTLYTTHLHSIEWGLVLGRFRQCSGAARRTRLKNTTNCVIRDRWCSQVEGEAYSPRTGHAVVVWGNYFFVFGGTDETARHNDIYMYETNSARSAGHDRNRRQHQERHAK